LRSEVTPEEKNNNPPLTDFESVKPAGVLWTSYPKGSSGMQTDLTRDMA